MTFGWGGHGDEQHKTILKVLQRGRIFNPSSITEGEHYKSNSKEGRKLATNEAAAVAAVQAAAVAAVRSVQISALSKYKNGAATSNSTENS